MSDLKIRNNINIFINGIEHTVTASEAFKPLAQFLRYSKGLAGTKVVCAEGDCGACTVLVSRLSDGKWSNPQSINSCIAPLYLFDLCSLITVEGLSQDEQLSEVQTQMRENHGGQCGYCTPGMVCAISALAEDCQRDGKKITEKRARNYLTGNLCRCTGYEPILKAATSLDLYKWQSLASKYLTSERAQTFQKKVQDEVFIEGEGLRIFAPANLSSALDYKTKNPHARLVAGATDLGVLHNKGRAYLDSALILNKISNLEQMTTTDKGTWIGARVTLTAFENYVAAEHPEFERLIRIFASPQIKNQGTLLGNVMNGSPIGDTLPALLVLEAVVELASATGTRIVPLTSFYRGYKVFDIQPNEIATGILIPPLVGKWQLKLFKVSVRKDLDISAVTFAGAFCLEGDKISQARLAMGGVGPTVIRLYDLEKEMVGQNFSEKLFKDVGIKVTQFITPISDLRASNDYRNKVAENLFSKCFFEIQEDLQCL